MAKKMTTNDKLKLVMSDFKLFAKNFIKIIDNNGDSVPFVLNPEQEQFTQEMTKYNIILKGRQIGFTTFSLAYMIYSAIVKPDTSYMIMTQHNKVTQSLLRKIKKMYKSLPHEKYPKLFPKLEISNRDEIYMSNGSRIMVATAGGEDSISGNTFELIHFSEMGKYPNEAQEEIIATAIPALAKNPYSKIIIESTAMGYNTYQEMFTKAFRGKESVWKAHFFSWLAKAYSSQFRHSFDEAENWFKLHNQGRRMSKKDLEHDERELQEKYGATFRQLMFRRYYIETNSLEKFQREFPTTPDEAFQTTNVSVFDTRKIVERLQYVLDPLQSKEVYEILPDILKPYINKYLFIYHLPKKSIRMYGGCDVASGTGKDFSTFTIFNAEGQQMAAWYSNDIPVYKFAEIVNELGRFFNYAFICVERNSYGLPMLEKLRKEYNYMNLLKQKVFDQKGKKKLQLGFMTTNTTKPIIIGDMKESFELSFINIECVRTLEEMKIYQDNNGKTGNKKGENLHDDMVISVAMSVQAMKQAKYYVDIAG
ncbi:terminase large subunit domain-containing protein [Fictibacillus phosphorivorans]|uniref:terminase large subunit domain-containing protein n=1 Tax=Fictibacillus phosphorivorans TaxID=1221500 RepID=UPI0020415159|nr:terminase family protein [Fictibacillus phosphorivorans]MCM3719176.1 terminase family protein [Fictibacillus phosphorivorans]MCM3776798.1 terminase family protein [Fictibacillus phosphorivorans]